MSRSRPLEVFLAALSLVLALCLAAPAFATEPRVGQPGKDVLWAPSSDGIVARMLELAKVGPGDVVLDLGSGDGKIPIAAARAYGARGLGVEFDAGLVAVSRREAAAAGVADTVSFTQGDLFEADLSQATVITLYLLPSLNLKLRPRLLALRPGVRVVSHAFDMGDWTPDAVATDGLRKAYLWIVPARIDGAWRAQSQSLGGGTIRFDQTYQMVSGAALFGRHGYRLRAGRLEGARLTFEVRGPDSRLWRVDGRFEGSAFVGRAASGPLSEPFAMRR